MVFCSSCGKEVSDDLNFCPHCGGTIKQNPSTNTTTHTYRQRSAWWYLLPIFFSIIGGLIAYFVIKDDDPKKAKNCLIIGLVLFVIGLIGMPFGL